MNENLGYHYFCEIGPTLIQDICCFCHVTFYFLPTIVKMLCFYQFSAQVFLKDNTILESELKLRLRFYIPSVITHRDIKKRVCIYLASPFGQCEIKFREKGTELWQTHQGVSMCQKYEKLYFKSRFPFLMSSPLQKG